MATKRNSTENQRFMSKYIRFDWAMKRLLRDKVNFVVLEGLLTTLLNRSIKIKSLLESESNQEDAFDKSNRVDLLAEEASGELILIEVQNNNEYAYFQRMIFGTSKLVTEYIKRGEGYHNVRKIYSINIVYFPLGDGDDYVYHGTTEFRGIHTGTLLNLSPFQMEKFHVDSVSSLFPEYYVLRVNDFNRLATTPLEQWIYFLNTGEIPDEATAPGLAEAREKLQLSRMTREELKSYYRHIDDLVILRDGREGSMEEGVFIGLQQGREAERIENARRMKQEGIDIQLIAKITNLTIEEMEGL